jgi:hypothetical protein
MTQALVGQLFVLPSEAVQGGRLAHLPAPTTALPREKPIPKPKPLTKWQKFAQVSSRCHETASAAHPVRDGQVLLQDCQVDAAAVLPALVALLLVNVLQAAACVLQG